jgi:hypothetical protein
VYIMAKRNLFRSIKTGLICFCAILSASVAQAAVTLPVELPVTDVESLAGLALVGLGVMWSIRKIIKTINRS